MENLGVSITIVCQNACDIQCVYGVVHIELSIVFTGLMVMCSEVASFLTIV